MLNIFLGTVSALLLSFYSSIAFAEELIWNSADCKKDKNPESLCVGDSCFDLCREGDGSFSTSVFYFVGDSCPRSFTKKPDIGMFVGDQELSACITRDQSRVALHKMNPNRVRFFAFGDCPTGHKYLAGTGSVSFCILE